MRAILNPKHDAHSPPLEIENGAIVPCYETPPRIAAIRTALEAAGGFTFEEPPVASEEALAAVHDLAYIAYLREAAAELRRRGGIRRASAGRLFSLMAVSPRTGGERSLRGLFCFDTYTPIMGGTFAAALGGASAALHAAELVASSADQQIYVLTRPPGHHAERDRCGGYCYFNNAALAAERLARLGKVAILDLDVHHGNGAQHIFWERADVLTVSIHGDPANLYPFFSGYTDEIGLGAGKGFNLNLPLPPGTTAKEYRGALATAVEAIAKFRPAFLVAAFGTDTHEADPIGGFKLPTGYFREMGGAVRELGVPTVVTQEGGYSLDANGPAVAGFLAGLAG